MATRLEVAVAMVKRLGALRAIEANTTHAPAIENPLGEGFTGVDCVGKKFRARIRACDALNGCDVRVTLGRFDCAEEAAFAYRAAHVALYGSYSWAAQSLTPAELYVVDITRKAALTA